MTAETAAIQPPAPVVHAKDLGSVRLLFTIIRNSLAVWPGYAFDVSFNRSTLFGIESVVINDPAGIRHVLGTNAANYVRPPVMPRILRSLLGNGLFLAEGADWRRQRRLLAPSFTPHSVNILIPHFHAAASDLIRACRGRAKADLSDLYQNTALNAALRALFSMPDDVERDRIGNLVCQYVSGPGRPQLLDGFAKSETSFAFSMGKRRAFQKRWFAVVDAVVDARRRAARAGGKHDLLDLLIAARDPETGEALAPEEIRDQCATMIFGGYETTARLLFWASYLLTLDPTEQERLRAEVSAFPPERVASLDDLARWPRLRLVLLEALRLYPPVPLLVRQPLEDDVIMGEQVKRGVQVYIVPWVLHRHRKYWQDPTAFLPGRFADQVSPWTSGGAYLPFGAGPRICIGAGFALAEAQIVLATLLQRYRLTLETSRPVFPVGRLTVQPSYAPNFMLEPV